MKPRKYIAHGEIIKGKLMKYNKPLFDDWIKGQNGRVTIEYVVQDEFKDEKTAMVGYYYAIVLPALVKGFWQTGDIVSPSHAHNKGLLMTTVGSHRVPINGKYYFTAKDTDNFNVSDWWIHINDLIVLIETEMHIKVAPPKGFVDNVIKNGK